MKEGRRLTIGNIEEKFERVVMSILRLVKGRMSTIINILEMVGLVRNSKVNEN